jgi:hypothetical protein
MNKKLHRLFQKAKRSSFYLWILNQVLWRGIPFNHPHKIKILSISDDEILLKLPYIKSNMNHLKGLHACALATACEYACGIQMIQHINADLFRLIMKDLQMEYHLQAKSDVFIKFRFSREDAENDILIPLKTQDAVFKKFTIHVADASETPICRASVNWQIKSWNKVRTKVE